MSASKLVAADTGSHVAESANALALMVNRAKSFIVVDDSESATMGLCK